MELLATREHPPVPSSLSPATSLCARTVVDSTGEVLGSIVDLLLDLERGRIAYAVVASGGFMGVGERLVAVPWNALMPGPGISCCKETRSVLESGPVVRARAVESDPIPSGGTSGSMRISARGLTGSDARA